MKINFKLILSFLLAVLLTSVSVSYFSFTKAREIAVENELKNMSEIINLIDIIVTSKSRLIGSTIQTAAGSSTIRTLFANIRDAKIRLTDEGFDYLNRLFQDLGQTNRIFLIYGDEVLMIRLEDAQAMAGQQQVQLDKVTFDAAQQGRIDGITRSIFKTASPVFLGAGQSLAAKSSKDPEFVLAGIRIPGENSVPMGILCEIDVKEYYSILPISMGLLQNQTTFIVDQQNKIISSNKSLDQNWVDEVVKTTTLGNRKYTFEDGKLSYFVYKQYNGLTGWNSYSIINSARIFPEQDILRNFIINFALVSTIFSGILFVLLSTHFTKPLLEVVSAMQQARNGNYGIRVNETRRDEIGELNKAYNFLIDEINRLINEVYKEKLAIKTAEINALQAQINPHFLYNTLDSINWMLIERGDTGTSRIIQSLGNMLRYSTNTEESVVPMSAEINFVRNYLLIQKNRMEDRLEYEISVPEELNNRMVPKLFLQPIVENAIKHGLSPQSKPGFIMISGEQNDEFTEITVEDTGAGMTREALEGLERQMKGDKEPSGDHIGLANVSARIRLKYGEEYGVSISSRQGQGTKVTVRLPGEKEA